MSAMTAQPILPDVDDRLAAQFWSAARENRLVVQSCADCGTLHFPPRQFCSECRSSRHEWRDVSGKGRIWSWVVAHGPTLPAFAEFTPYPVVVVELAEPSSLRMVGNLVANAGAPINSVPPEQISIGMPVEVCFHSIDERVTLPLWCPARSPAE
jgi:uncharacterized OB-fold protein